MERCSLIFLLHRAAAYVFNAGLVIEDYTDVQGGSALNSVLEEVADVTQPVSEMVIKGEGFIRIRLSILSI